MLTCLGFQGSGQDEDEKEEDRNDHPDGTTVQEEDQPPFLRYRVVLGRHKMLPATH